MTQPLDDRVTAAVCDVLHVLQHTGTITVHRANAPVPGLIASAVLAEVHRQTTAAEAPARRTADSITDDELDALYAELDALRAAVGSGPRDGLSSPLAASQGSGGAPDVGGRDDASGGRTAAPDGAARRRRWEDTYRQYDAYDYPDLATIGMTVADAEQAELHAQLADARKYAGQIEETLTAAYQASNEAERRRAERAARVIRVETALARVRALCDDADRRGITSGPPLTTDRIRAALTPQADDTTVGSAVLTVVVTAPNQENADQWAGTLRDLIAAEHGDEMRLHMTIRPAPADQPERTQP